MGKFGQPDHVPDALVVDFDPYQPMKPGEEYHDGFIRMHAAGVPPIYWCPQNGGHWVVTSHDILWELFPDYQNFSSKYLAAPKSVNPPDEYLQIPLQADPPDHSAYRSLFASAFTLPAVKAREAEVRDLAIRLTEELKPQGRCDFASDFAHHLPVKVFMRMLDVPDSERQKVLDYTHAAIGPVTDKRPQAFIDVAAYLGTMVDERSANPGDDVFSRIVTGKIHGEPIKRHRAIAVCSLLLLGGLDTTATMMGFAMNYLAKHPDKRRMLIENPSLVSGAADEFLRRYSLLAVGRVANRDVNVHGVTIKEGDMLLLSTQFGALDPKKYDRPAEVDFTRKSPESTTFGNGHHRCPGNMLARAELRVMLEEWLKRIPDFRLDPDRPPVFHPGTNASLGSLPLVWNA